jgi:GH15 family glucan-1,4-alpha-glucosidase
MAPRIEGCALIGDMHSCALVARNGSIDWLCWPRFDSDACFAALLGDDRHGRWSLAPTQNSRVVRRYRDGSLGLETDFTSSDYRASRPVRIGNDAAGQRLLALACGCAHADGAA